jgi:hypothetical protein
MRSEVPGLGIKAVVEGSAPGDVEAVPLLKPSGSFAALDAEAGAAVPASDLSYPSPPASESAKAGPLRTRVQVAVMSWCIGFLLIRRATLRENLGFRAAPLHLHGNAAIRATPSCGAFCGEACWSYWVEELREAFQLGCPVIACMECWARFGSALSRIH